MKRSKRRNFPRFIFLTPDLAWSLGFFKAEGLSSRRSRAYYRFHLTNKNPLCLKKVLDTLHFSGLLPKSNIHGRCFQIHHSENITSEVIRYWSIQLGFPSEMFQVKDYPSLCKKENGVCRIDLSDPLLRRILDLLNDKLMKKNISRG